MIPSPALPRFAGAPLLLIVAALAGCVSLEKAAPPVALLGVTDSRGTSGALERGRLIYITRCAKCHSVEPVTKYSRREWDEILPEMAAKTKLNASDDAAVRSYVLAVLARGPVL